MWAYQQEENQARREFLKKAYEGITGNDIGGTRLTTTAPDQALPEANRGA
jgi:hypothetical protein